MHADMAGDDHLEPGQADAGVRQHGEIKRALGVGHVHHDLQRGRRHLPEIGGDAFERQAAFIDEPGVALGARDGHFGTIRNPVEAIAGADNGRHAQLARNDRGVAGAPAAIGDDGRGTLHHRLPVGIGHVGDEHIAGLDPIHVLDRAHDARRAAADFLANRTPFGEHRAACLQMEAFDLRGACA